MNWDADDGRVASAIRNGAHMGTNAPPTHRAVLRKLKFEAAQLLRDDWSEEQLSEEEARLAAEVQAILAARNGEATPCST